MNNKYSCGCQMMIACNYGNLLLKRKQFMSVWRHCSSTRYLTVIVQTSGISWVYHVNTLIKKILFTVLKESMLPFTHDVKYSNWCLSSCLVTSNRCEKLSQFVFFLRMETYITNPHIGLPFLWWSNFSVVWHYKLKITVALFIFAIFRK